MRLDQKQNALWPVFRAKLQVPEEQLQHKQFFVATAGELGESPRGIFVVLENLKRNDFVEAARSADFMRGGIATCPR